ncbi:MAG: hypothetical protein JNL13_01445 [Chitinophagaceae bacterium]|nr:hypothetical protein [Chitinophagaceae bacterium]
MNRDELEQWMKSSLAEQEFRPDEAGWMKLRAAMDAPRDHRKKALILLLPKRTRVAAAAAIVITAGSLLYLGSRKQENRTAHTVKVPPASPSAAPEQPKALAPALPDPQPLQASGTSRPPLKKETAATPPVADSNYEPGIYAHTPQAAGQADSPARKINVYAQVKTDAPADPGPFDPRYSPGEQSSPSFNLGIAAQVGKANVGNMRYQVGLVAHQEISGNLYAEATLALAATEVSYVQTSSFPSLTVSSGSFNNTSMSIASKSVEAQYANNVLSAGVSPALGYRLTPKLALGCGMSLYRNLNPTVSLKEDAAMDQAVLDNHLLSESNPVSNWDAGLTGNAAYTIGNKLALSIQYRHGLSTFMYREGQPVRNSGVNMGLKYLFGK